MNQPEQYTIDLMLFILVMIVFCIIILSAINIIFYILKRTKLFHEKRVIILTNALIILIFFVIVTPIIIDVSYSSYSTVVNVVNVETNFKTKYSDSYVLITDASGNSITCYDFLIDTSSLKNISYPLTIVYAEHSKLIVDFYTTQ